MSSSQPVPHRTPGTRALTPVSPTQPDFAHQAGEPPGPGRTPNRSGPEQVSSGSTGAHDLSREPLTARLAAGRTGTLAHRPDAGLTHCTGGGISGYDHAVCTIHVLTAP